MKPPPLSRRTLLRGCGIALALPWLEAMEPLGVLASTPRPAPRRLGVVYVPNGIHMPDWTPTATGRDYRLPAILEPLADFKSDFSILTGLAAHRADGPSGNHARALAVFLTGQRPPDTGREHQLGISMDQLAAQVTGRETRLASLEISGEPAQQAGQCDNPYSCAYTSCIAWSSPTTPLPTISNPQQLFDRIFPTQASATDARRHRGSILDFVRIEATTLRMQLGGADRRRIDEYLTAVRDVEMRMGRTVSTLPNFPRPTDAPLDYPALLRLLCDLLVLAWQTDTTRVATFLFANEFSNRPYPFLDVRGGHHDLSHHGNDPVKLAKIRTINRFHVTQFASLLSRLRNVREGDRTLLDNCMIVYGCGNSDGNRHNHDNLPILVAGKGGNSLRTGHHLRFERELPLTNLWLTLLGLMGVTRQSFGDSTGPLSALIATP